MKDNILNSIVQQEEGVFEVCCESGDCVLFNNLKDAQNYFNKTTDAVVLWDKNQSIAEPLDVR